MKQQKERQDDDAPGLSARLKDFGRRVGGIRAASRALGVSREALMQLVSGMGRSHPATVFMVEARLRELEAADREGAK